jgi:hypothetical protein
LKRQLIARSTSDLNAHNGGTTMNDRTSKDDSTLLDRRDFVALSVMLSAAALLPRSARAGEPAPLPQDAPRRLGSLEVSPIGLGCMSMVAAPTTLRRIRGRWSRSSARPSTVA